MNPLTEKFLARRDMSGNKYKDFDDPTIPYPLKNLDVACELIHSTSNRLDGHDLVVVMPDFDTDGVMSGVIGFAGLCEMGVKTALYVPQPFAKDASGYGITEHDVDRVMRMHPNAGLLLTCDVGTSCGKAIRYANERYHVPVLVTDHHEPPVDPEDACPARTIIVNPRQKGERYVTGSICGAFVLWQVLDHYVRRYHGNDMHLVDQIRRLRVFAGIGTVSDSMKLAHENRAIVREAVSFCDAFYCGVRNKGWYYESVVSENLDRPYGHAFHGLWLLMREAARTSSNAVPKDLPLHEDFFSFYLAPVINSAKRTEHAIEYVFGVFFGPMVMEYDPHGELESEPAWKGMSPEECAKKLFEFNSMRKHDVDRLMDDYMDGKLERHGKSIVICEGVCSGYFGLLANKVSEHERGPALVMERREIRVSDGAGGEVPYVWFKGSGRSPDYIDALDLIRQGPDFLSAAGHQQAFGCSVGRPSNKVLISPQDADKALDMAAEYLDTESDRIKDVFRANGGDVSGNDADIVISTQASENVPCDSLIDLGKFAEFLSDVERMRPFGKGFAEPIVEVVFDIRDVGYIVMTNGVHLKVLLPYGLSCLCWKQGSMATVFEEAEKDIEHGKHGALWSAVGVLQYNVYRGEKSIVLGNATLREYERAASF